MSGEVEYGPDERTSIKQSFKHDLEGDDDESLSPGRRKWLKPVPKRYILAIMMFLGCCNIYALRVNMSVAVVAMVNNYTVVVNGTEITIADFEWTPGMQGILLGAFFWGYTITQIPGGWLSSRFGGKMLFGGGILCTGVFTILTPPAAELGGLPLLVALRILEGLFEGVTYPCTQALWSKWAPPLERSRLATIGFSGSYVGTMISLPLSGLIAELLGWPWIFYIFGIVALIWYVFWCWLVVESPLDHSTITSNELEYITESIGFSYMQSKDCPIPWKAIFKSLPFWAIAVAHFAENWGFYTLLTELPTFLNDIFAFNMSKAGLLAALPYLAMSIMMQIGGHLADLMQSKRWLSTTNVRKLLNCSAFIGQTVFMVIAAYTMTPTSAVTCITFAVGIGGFAWAGFGVSPLDIAPQHASIIWGLSNTLASTSGIIAPAVAGHLTMDRTPQEWRSVFYLSASIYCIGTLFYGIFASGNLEPWAKSDYGKKNDVEPPERSSTPGEVVEYESGHEELK